MKPHCHDRISQLIDKAKWSPKFKCANRTDDNKLLCPSNHTVRYRSFDGNCNNLNYPTLWGVALTGFRRNLPPRYSDGIGSPRTTTKNRTLPEATTVSAKVHRPLYRNDPNFTVMLAVWGQFLDHDITATALSQGRNGSAISCCRRAAPNHPECFPVLEELSGKCMEFVRSAPAPNCCLGPRNQMNQASAYIDASVVYGSDKELSDKLRTFQYGYLRMLTTKDGRDLLPPSLDVNDGCNRENMNNDNKYCFLSGDARANENLHLTTMHLLWARNHNNIAKALMKINPFWTDEKLFQEARRILSAQIQHITYTEFLPIILGRKTTERHKLDANTTYKYNDTIDASVANEFASAAFRFAHTLIPGLMKILANDTSSPEFIELHKMLFDPYRLYLTGELDDVIRGAISTNIEASDTYFSEELKSKLFQDVNDDSNNNDSKSGTHCGGLDLVALNIQRGRDHGLAGYPEWRQFCGLEKPQRFSDLRHDMDNDSVERISELYSDVEDLDLYTGALSERPLRGSLLGPTASCLIVDQFVRLKYGDRFWYENRVGPQAFTAEQLEEVKRTSLASVICETADEIMEITPLVMQREDESNKKVNCSDLPKPDLEKWKDYNDY